VIYNVSGSVPGRGSGIQIDAGTSGATIAGNTISSVLTGIYLITPATVRNNSVSRAGTRCWRRMPAAPSITTTGTIHRYFMWTTAVRISLNGRRPTSIPAIRLRNTGPKITVAIS